MFEDAFLTTPKTPKRRPQRQLWRAVLTAFTILGLGGFGFSVMTAPTSQKVTFRLSCGAVHLPNGVHLHFSQLVQSVNLRGFTGTVERVGSLQLNDQRI